MQTKQKYILVDYIPSGICAGVSIHCQCFLTDVVVVAVVGSPSGGIQFSSALIFTEEAFIV
eukprot:4428272-Pyramimonas_sp.AAC.2